MTPWAFRAAAADPEHTRDLLLEVHLMEIEDAVSSAGR
jgi:hypothetical protein